MKSNYYFSLSALIIFFISACTTQSSLDELESISSELGERLLSIAPWGGSIVPVGADDPIRGELLINRLPNDFPFILPIPPNTLVLGSYIKPDDIVSLEIQILLDVDADLSEISAFYKSEFTNLGFSEPNLSIFSFIYPEGYFDQGRSIFCNGEDIMVEVEIREQLNNLTDVRIFIDLYHDGYDLSTFCNPPKLIDSDQTSPISLTPRLSFLILDYGPPGSSIRQGGGRWSDDGGLKSIEIQSHLTLQEVMDFYIPLYEEEDLVVISSEIFGQVGVVEFEFPVGDNGAWSGRLVISAVPVGLETYYYIIFVAESQ